MILARNCPVDKPTDGGGRKNDPFPISMGNSIGGKCEGTKGLVDESVVDAEGAGTVDLVDESVGQEGAGVIGLVDRSAGHVGGIDPINRVARADL